MIAGIEKGINTQKTSADDIIKTAQKYIGVLHCMRGTTVKCMDFSGLLVTVFAKNGIHLPHNPEEQARYGKIISILEELKRGDLVFFIESYKTHSLITQSGISCSVDVSINRCTHLNSYRAFLNLLLS
jgi:murein DD-endopeptidase / murein LD-carboxypeptidase